MGKKLDDLIKQGLSDDDIIAQADDIDIDIDDDAEEDIDDNTEDPDVAVVDTTDGVQTDEVQTIKDLIAKLPHNKLNQLIGELLDEYAGGIEEDPLKDSSAALGDINDVVALDDRAPTEMLLEDSESLPGPYKAPGAGGTALAKLISSLGRMS